MISVIAHLPEEEIRALRELVGASGHLPAEDELLNLTHGLRSALDVPADGDLGDYFRRRLLEAIHTFGLFNDTDLLSDWDLSDELLGFLLEATRALVELDRMGPLGIFLRTKSKHQRAQLVVDARRYECLVTGDRFDWNAELRKAQFREEHPETHLKAASDIVRAISHAAETTPRGISAFTTHAAAAGQRRTSYSLAPPLAAIAASLYLGGWSRLDPTSGRLVQRDCSDLVALRRQRARRSTVIQTTVIVCVFLHNAEVWAKPTTAGRRARSGLSISQAVSRSSKRRQRRAPSSLA